MSDVQRQFIEAVRDQDQNRIDKLVQLLPNLDFIFYEYSDMGPERDYFSWLLDFCPEMIERLFVRGFQLGKVWAVDTLIENKDIEPATIANCFLDGCRLGRTEMVKLLLKKVDFYKWGELGFSRAIMNNRFDTAEVVFDHGLDLRHTDAFIHFTEVMECVPRSLLEKVFDQQSRFFTDEDLKLVWRRAKDNDWVTLEAKVEPLCRPLVEIGWDDCPSDPENFGSETYGEGNINIGFNPSLVADRSQVADIRLMSCAIVPRQDIPVWKKNLDTISNMQDSKADTKLTCVVCLENEPIIVFNCGHKKTCAGCTTELLKTTRKCPVCRTEICMATKVYE